MKKLLIKLIVWLCNKFKIAICVNTIIDFKKQTISSKYEKKIIGVSGTNIRGLE